VLPQGCTSTAPVTVLVTDTCKDCAVNQININALTYEKHLSSTTGQVAVTWRRVSARLG
jgi:expansin (peptidoglycan-binding protein)